MQLSHLMPTRRHTFSLNSNILLVPRLQNRHSLLITEVAVRTRLFHQLLISSQVNAPHVWSLCHCTWLSHHVLLHLVSTLLPIEQALLLLTQDQWSDSTLVIFLSCLLRLALPKASFVHISRILISSFNQFRTNMFLNFLSVNRLILFYLWVEANDTRWRYVFTLDHCISSFFAFCAARLSVLFLSKYRLVGTKLQKSVHS